MKLLLPVALFSVGFTILVAGDFSIGSKGPKGVVKQRPTHGDIAKLRKERTTDAKIEPAEEVIKMQTIRSDRTEGLIKRSAILSSDLNWTIVPKESVLHVPGHLAKRVNAERKGKLVPWREFVAKNRGWIQTQEVSILEARGEELVEEEKVEVYRSSGRVVIAVLHDGPISVKAPKAASEVATERPGASPKGKGQPSPTAAAPLGARPSVQ